MEKGLHSGHRARLRARVEANGIASLAPHEQVEYLLFDAIPRRDVNPLAHELLARFGSLEAICAASVEELTAFRGIGRKAAAHLRAIPRIAITYQAARLVLRKEYGRTEIEELVLRRLAHATDERLILLCFNSRMELLFEDCIARGTPASVQASMRSLLVGAMTEKTAAVVLAHSHPGGFSFPSDEDRYFTLEANDLFGRIGVQLIEHYIVADGTIRPIMAPSAAEQEGLR